MNNVELIEKVYETFGRGDIPALMKLFDSGIEWYPAEGHPYSPEGKPWVGKEALVKDFFQKIAPDWEIFGCRPAHFHDAGERVVVEGRYFGSHKKTGLKLDAQFCHVWKLKDGKVLSFRQYADTAQLQKVMGRKSN